MADFPISKRNYVLGSSRRIPYDSQVEYLESTSQQYIDCELYGNRRSGNFILGPDVELDNPTCF